MAKEKFDEEGFAGTCRADEEVVAFGRKVGGRDVVEVEVSDALDVAEGHEGERTARGVLGDIAVSSDLIEDLLGSPRGKIFDEMKEGFFGVGGARISARVEAGKGRTDIVNGDLAWASGGRRCRARSSLARHWISFGWRGRSRR